MVQRERTSSECRNCTIESTWSANFDIGKVATSDSKVSSQGALTGRYTRLRSIFGVCAIARSTLPSFGSWGCSQDHAPGRLTIADRVANRNSDPRSLKHDRAGVVFFLHMKDRGLDFVKIEPLAQHVNQIELAADDAPRRADREGGGFGVHDRRVPALMDRFVSQSAVS